MGDTPRISTQTLPLPVQASRTVAEEVPDTPPPPGCFSGSCFPPTGNLIIGHGQRLRTSSTCGLHGFEPYCIVSHRQVRRRVWALQMISGFSWAGDPESHGIENVVSQSGPGGRKTWWQAESGEGACVPMCAGLRSGVRAWSLTNPCD